MKLVMFDIGGMPLFSTFPAIRGDPPGSRSTVDNSAFAVAAFVLFVVNLLWIWQRC